MASMAEYKAAIDAMYRVTYIIRDVSLYAHNQTSAETAIRTITEGLNYPKLNIGRSKALSPEAQNYIKTEQGRLLCQSYIEAFLPAAATVAALESSPTRPMPLDGITRATNIASIPVTSLIARLEAEALNLRK